MQIYARTNHALDIKIRLRSLRTHCRFFLGLEVSLFSRDTVGFFVLFTLKLGALLLRRFEQGNNLIVAIAASGR